MFSGSAVNKSKKNIADFPIYEKFGAGSGYGTGSLTLTGFLD
jgi:hypothetical protein